MANIRVKCVKNTQIFYNDKGLFKVLVFFANQEYEIDETVYKMKPEAFELLTTTQPEGNFEPRTTIEEPIKHEDEKVEPQPEIHEPVEENLEPTTTEEPIKNEVEVVEPQPESQEPVKENLEPSVSTVESVESQTIDVETQPESATTTETTEEKQSEPQTTSKRKRKSSNN